MGKPKSRIDSSVVLFDVFYEDGTRASNRKVPASEVGGLDGDAPALTWIMEQEQKISEMSGKAPRDIKKLVRSGRS
jgi:hypothetical protein